MDLSSVEDSCDRRLKNEKQNIARIIFKKLFVMILMGLNYLSNLFKVKVLYKSYNLIK
jgi:hypothetical protein